MKRQSVIDWYVSIYGKRNTTFLVFTIESFYPSISLKLFDKTRFALSHNNDPWLKTNGEEKFTY